MSIVLALVLLISLATFNINFCSGSFTNEGCVESERQALFMFKQDLIDHANLLASWSLYEDCCRWHGVVCDNVTAHVLELHLRNPQPLTDDYGNTIKRSKLRGKINPSLLKLKYLSYLDLSNNAFGGIPIPKFLGSFESLRHLNLSNAGFGGLVPLQLGNLSSLQYLNLYTDYADDLYVANLQWLSGFSMLEHLDLGYVNLRKASNWLQMLNKLPHLQKLYLSSCQLPPVPPPINLNLSSLAILDLSKNSFENPLAFSWIFHLTNLVSLDLSHNKFKGCLFDGLQNMTSLRHLDLSDNSFNSSIPSWLYNLNSLQFLNLCWNNLQGKISSAIENMTSLRHLDLSYNYFNSSIPNWLYHPNSIQFLNLGFNNFQGKISSAIGNMTSLRHLDLSGNSFNSSIPDCLYNLKTLQSLNLGYNNLQGKISSAIGNMTSAISLDFSGNELEGRIPRTMGNLCNLKSIHYSGVNLSQDVSVILEILSGCVSKQLDFLDLSECQLFGQLTNQLGSLKVLKELHLYGNSISGPIPSSIGKLSSLRFLKIDKNKLQGHLPESLGQLANLEMLDISSNLFEGVVSEIHFGNLTELKFFYASNSSLSLKVNPDWIPPFDLLFLGLSSCDVGSKFPLWLHSQQHLAYLDISNSMISDSVPSWVWNLPFRFQYFNLSHNRIRGQIPNIPRTAFPYCYFDFGFNNFSGEVPQVSSNLSVLVLSNNFFSGSLSPLLCYKLKEPMETEVLNLGENSLSGEIPDCWMNWQNLKLLKLDNNRLTGSIPRSMGTLQSLRLLQLQKNLLSGEIPLSLKKCTNLVLLDLGENDLCGHIPKSIGDSFRKLKVLRLRANKFSGYIPDELCVVGCLQILDLAKNDLFGSLPRCVSNFTAMAKINGSAKTVDSFTRFYGFFVASVMMKGQMLEFSTTLNLVRSIDFSDNKLSGEIPMEITSLFELQSLNLSHNLLTGKIPNRIGEMRSLESVDFSVNKLSGSIPESMSNLTFLSHLNVSCNNLIGEIPLSTQLQSFDPSSYDDNHLCGLPIPEKCSTNDPVLHKIGTGAGENGNGFEIDWFYYGMPFGFVIGFWSVFGPLVIGKRLHFGVIKQM